MKKFIQAVLGFGIYTAQCSAPVEEVTTSSCWNCCKSVCTRQNINAALEDVRAVAHATDVVVAIAAPTASPIVHLVTTAVEAGAQALEIPEPEAVEAAVVAAAPAPSSAARRRSSVATPHVEGGLTTRTLKRTSVVSSSVASGHIATPK